MPEFGKEMGKASKSHRNRLDTNKYAKNILIDKLKNNKYNFDKL